MSSFAGVRGAARFVSDRLCVVMALSLLGLLPLLGLLAACATSSSPTDAVAVSTALPRPTPTAAPQPSPTTAPAAAVSTPRPVPPDLTAYAGLGAWVDVFDWAPAYAGAGGPAVTVADLDTMADAGVTTVYLQASRRDDVGSGLIESPEVLADLIGAAHNQDIAVVGWYLPTWDGDGEDLARLVAIAEFSEAGERFDGIAVDIEGVPDIAERADWNERLVELSRDLHAAVDPLPVGAIVLPPTLIEVVNTEYWPDFPWTEIAPFYDVWLPMSYWSFRSDDSPFANGYRYNADSTERLRRNLGDDQAFVHAIGGVGAVTAANTANDPAPASSEPLAAADELDDFVRSLVDTGAIGGSIYDWASTDTAARQTMTTAMNDTGLLLDR